MTRAKYAIAVGFLMAACSHPKPEGGTADEKADSGLVTISIEAQRHIGLEVEAASVHELNEYLQVSGTVQPVDSRVNTVRTLARGRLAEVRVRVGDRVRAGAALATYDNIEAGELAAQLASARAELERLRVQERSLSRQSDRAHALADIGAIPKKESEQAAADRQQAEQNIHGQESVIEGLLARMRRFGVSQPDRQGTPLTTITSPIAGVITKLDASPGEVIEPSTALFTVTDLSAVWVQAEVYEKDLGRLRVGQDAWIHVDAYPAQRFIGKVTYVSDFLDSRTRTARVRCEVLNSDMRLKLDMYATVSLPTTFRRTTMAVPAVAIQEAGNARVVFVRKTPTQFETRRVSIGTTVGDLVEITNGLTAGEPIVKTGAFHLKSILLGKELGEE